MRFTTGCRSCLAEAGFDAFVEEVCKPYYAARMGAPSLPPGRYFRMHMIGYFEGIDSERGIAWRCAGLVFAARFPAAVEPRQGSRSFLAVATRSRLPHEAHEKVFGWVLKLVAERGLVKGERIGVDGSTMEANAALRTIVRRDSGESYREMLTRMAQGERRRDADGRGPDRASTASAKARRCRTPTGRARLIRTPRSPR